MVKAITFNALREYKKKRKWIQVNGDGFYHWNENKLTVPPKGKVTTNSIRTDFSDWEDYDGDIPPSKGVLDWRLKIYFKHFDPNKSVIDLSNL